MLQNVAKQAQVTLVTGKELLAEVTSVKNVTSCVMIKSSGRFRLCSNYGTEFPMCRTSIEFATDKVTINRRSCSFYQSWHSEKKVMCFIVSELDFVVIMVIIRVCCTNPLKSGGGHL